MKCLVLGGGGFLGSHASEALLGAGHGVRVFEKELVNRESVAHLLPKVEWTDGDFTNETHVKEAVAGVDCVIHSLCTTLPKTSNDNPVYDISSNLISTLHLLEASRDAGVKKIIFFSSGGTVYGIPRYTPIPEEHPNDPVCAYGIQKLAIEKYLMLFRHLYGLDYGIMRISNPFGERQRPHASQGAAVVFLNKVLKGETIEIWGDGSVTRDYLYVKDVAGAVLKLLDYNGDQRIFNIGSGKGMSLLQLIEAIEKVAGRKAKVRFTPSRSFDVPVNVLDIKRAGKELGWRPEAGFEEGLRLTMDYLSAHL